ncbi:MAG: diguanylate cyclase [Clostridia bacterium]|nr:diguanylate cyclase [Clostridia bacterium]
MIRFNGLKYKILLPIFIIALLGFVVSSLVEYFYIRNLIKDEYIQTAQNKVGKLQIAVDGIIEKWQSEIRLLTTCDSVQTLDWSNALPYLKKNIAFLDDFSFLLLSDCNGDYKTTTGGKGNIRDKTYFTKAMEGIPSISEPILYEKSGTAIVIISCPIRDSKGNIAGLIGGAVNLSDITTTVGAEKIQNGYTVMMDQEGLILSHPDSNSILRDYFLKEKNGPLISKISGMKYGAEYFQEDNFKKTLVYANINSSDWIIGTVFDHNKISGSINTVRNFFLFFELFSAFLICFLIFIFINRSVLKKIRSLQKAAENIANENWNYRIDSTGNDEIGKLSEAFNFMTEKLQTSYLKLHQEISQKEKAEEALTASEFRYHSLFNEMSEGMSISEMVFDSCGKPINYKFLDTNASFEAQFNFEKDYIIGKTALDVLQKSEYKTIEIFGEVVKTGTPVKFELFMEKIGKYFEIMAFRTEKGKFAILTVDISERKQAVESLTRERELLKVTLHSIKDGVITTDADGRISIMNTMAEEILSKSFHELNGRYINEVFRLFDLRTKRPIINPYGLLLSQRKVRRMDDSILFSTEDGMEKVINLAGSPIKDANGNNLGTVIVFRDITDKKKKDEEIRFLSYYDQLTGFFNRSYFEQILKKLDIKQNLPLSVISVDINGLKLANDVFGHFEGDLMIQKISEIIKDSIRSEDVVARWGGDEFIIVLPKTLQKDALKICERISYTCQNDDSSSIQLSISLGCSSKDLHDQSIHDIIKEAEDLMLRHKLLESKSMHSAIILSLQKTLYERSYETEEHAQRMYMHAAQLGQAVGLSENEQDELNLFALLHDIGKIGVPDSILMKTGKLTDEEWIEMKKHCEIGYRIAESTKGLSHISKYILSHHERWDGNGYPQGLKGTEIPKLSRILSIIDAFDVMTHTRPYKKNAFVTQEALNEIKRCSGTQFDPEFVEIFIDMMLQEAAG